MKKATTAQLREFAKDPTFRALMTAFSSTSRRRHDDLGFAGPVTTPPRVIGIEFSDGAVFREPHEPLPPDNAAAAEQRAKIKSDWNGKAPMPKPPKPDYAAVTRRRA